MKSRIMYVEHKGINDDVREEYLPEIKNKPECKDQK